MKPALLLGCVFAAVAAVAIIASLGPSEADGLPYMDAEVTRQGKTLYGEYCAVCHGNDLEGQAEWRVRDTDGYLPAPPHDETGHTWHHPDSQLISITELGTERIVGGGYRSNMAGFQDVMTQEEIIAVLAYIKSTWPQEVIDMHNRVNAEANG